MLAEKVLTKLLKQFQYDEMMTEYSAPMATLRSKLNNKTN